MWPHQSFSTCNNVGTFWSLLHARQFAYNRKFQFLSISIPAKQTKDTQLLNYTCDKLYTVRPKLMPYSTWQRIKKNKKARQQ